VSTVRPVRRQVVVGAPPERTFALFTERIGEWWPMAEHSVFGDGATVAFEGRGLVERDGDRVTVWAEVTVWEPPNALELDWHPGRAGETATRVRVTFEADDERTVVTLEHDGWERLADPDAAREVLEEARFQVERDGDRLLVEADGHPTDPEDISRALAERRIYVRELTPLRADLESVFLQLTRGTGLETHLPHGRPAPDVEGGSA